MLVNGAKHALRRRGHVEIGDPERRKRVQDRVHDRRWRADRARLSAALGAQRIVRAERGVGLEGERDEVVGARHAVVHERARLKLAALAIVNCVLVERLARVLAPLKVARMPLAEPPPRESRFGSPLQLSTVHWVRPEVVVEVTYLTRTEDNLLRQVSYQGQREDKPARLVVRPISNR